LGLLHTGGQHLLPFTEHCLELHALIFGVDLARDTFRWRFHISVESLKGGIVQSVLTIGGRGDIVGVNGRKGAGGMVE
jgi:hypothetical protein